MPRLIFNGETLAAAIFDDPHELDVLRRALSLAGRLAGKPEVRREILQMYAELTMEAPA